jgi:hypothetical protein
LIFVVIMILLLVILLVLLTIGFCFSIWHDCNLL